METHKSSLTPKFFFLSLGLLITLITTVTSSLILFFETLNNKFPDALTSVYQYGYNNYDFEGIRAALSTIIIVFPLFLVISHFWNKESRTKLGSSNSVIRKWAIYLILFLASVVIISDLVTLVRYFVSGEITVRFILKVLGVFVASGLTGSYYIFQLRSYESRPKNVSKIYSLASIILVLGLITLSFMTTGSPVKQRALRFDSRRISDLQSIQSQVIYHWQQKEKLPQALSELATPISSYSVPVDPEFEKGKAYEYRVLNPMTFELCATFTLPLPQGWKDYSSSGGIGMSMPERDMAVSSSYPGYGGGMINESWDHQEGRTCFSRTIDRDMYPPFPKQPKQ